MEPQAMTPAMWTRLGAVRPGQFAASARGSSGNDVMRRQALPLVAGVDRLGSRVS
jgi:hypothetical protein